MSIKTVLKVVLFVSVGLITCGIIYLVYAELSMQLEASHVEAAIRRDCGLDMEVEPSEIREPGNVVKHYIVDDFPMEMVCYGPNWGCDCAQSHQGNVPIVEPEIESALDRSDDD